MPKCPNGPAYKKGLAVRMGKAIAKDSTKLHRKQQRLIRNPVEPEALRLAGQIETLDCLNQTPKIPALMDLRSNHLKMLINSLRFLNQ